MPVFGRVVAIEPMSADRHQDVVWAYADAMNAWYIGAIAVLALTIAFVMALPDGCDDALLGCDGIRGGWVCC